MPIDYANPKYAPKDAIPQQLHCHSPLMDGVSQLQNQMLPRSHVPNSSLIFIFFVVFHSDLGHIAPQ